MNIWYNNNNNILPLDPDHFQKRSAAPVTWELVNTGWLCSAHKLVSSGRLLCACRLDLAAQKRKSNAHVANRQTWVSTNMADLLRGQIRDNRLSSFTLLFTSGPSSTSLPPSFQSQLLRKRLLWDAVAESKSSPWQRRPVSPSLNFNVFVWVIVLIIVFLPVTFAACTATSRPKKSAHNTHTHTHTHFTWSCCLFWAAERQTGHW